MSLPDTAEYWRDVKEGLGSRRWWPIKEGKIHLTTDHSIFQLSAADPGPDPRVTLFPALCGVKVIRAALRTKVVKATCKACLKIKEDTKTVAP